MTNSTCIKFGYPNTLIKEYNNWILLLRPEQVTLGSLVLICKDEVNSFSHISDDSFREYPIIIREIEQTLTKLYNYDKINYLMLMMVDQDVHFHIIPRYSENKQFGNMIFKDFGWSGLPELLKINNITDDVFKQLIEYIKKSFNN